VKAALFLPCAQGVEALLADELKRLGARHPKAQRGGVAVDGDTRLAMKLNLESRLAQRVLWPLAHGAYRHEQNLYDLARDAVRWADWITPRQTLRVDTTAQRAPLQSLNFASLRIKDAVCDALRDASGERPSVDTRAPRLARRRRAEGRSAAEGNAGRGHARRCRLAGPRGGRAAARPRLRRRHDRDRSRPARLRSGARRRAAFCVREAGPVPRGSRRLARHAARSA
jgi:hypothetical protein